MDLNELDFGFSRSQYVRVWYSSYLDARMEAQKPLLGLGVHEPSLRLQEPAYLREEPGSQFLVHLFRHYSILIC